MIVPSSNPLTFTPTTDHAPAAAVVVRVKSLVPSSKLTEIVCPSSASVVPETVMELSSEAFTLASNPTPAAEIFIATD